jgi:hypothetical protein
MNNKLFFKENQFYLVKTIKYKSDTSKSFWRWRNFFIRTWCYLINSLFIFCLVIPFVSALSFRALFSMRPYYPEKIVNKFGQLEEDKNSKKLTFISRISALWRHVRISRKKFEDTPDKGLLGKGLTRIFNVIWNYLIKGFFGTISLVLIFPILCIMISTGSIVLGVLTPLWYPILSILHHLSFLIIFDWDYPKGRSCIRLFPFLRIILQFLICAILVPIISLITAILICPILSFLIAVFALIRNVLRKTWDSLMYFVILKKLARIPSEDTFVARRTAGPGLASKYFYQMKPEQALAALEVYIELEIIRSYFEFVKQKLNEPLEIYKKIFCPMFKPYSFQLDTLSGPYEKLNKEIEIYNKEYEKICNERINVLQKTIINSKISHVRLNENSLKIVLHQSSKIVKFYYENVILKYKKESVKKFFEDKSIDENDWTALTGYVLENLFGSGILTPLEETFEDSFNLEVDHLNLLKYSQMIANSEIRDDLDVVITNYTLDKESVSISIPEISNLMFKPNENYLNLYPNRYNIIFKKQYLKLFEI